jgi:phosphoglucosamine mutase
MVKLGKAIGKVIGKNGGKVVIGKDTRISSYILETALSSGFLSVGIDVDLAGVIPTPAVAHITKVLNADIGIMISASHNPAEDNGVKVFDKNGFKLADDIEEQIEIAFGKEFVNSRIGSLRRVKEIRGRYIAHAHDTIGAVDLKGVKIVLDCANGAAYKVAPLILKELGASLIVLNADPNGENINDNCGAMHPEVICRKLMQILEYLWMVMQTEL